MDSVNKTDLTIGERAMIIGIQGNLDFQNYLLTNGISLGTIITKNYSPSFTKLINFSVAGKMMSIRVADFEQIEWVKI